MDEINASLELVSNTQLLFHCTGEEKLHNPREATTLLQRRQNHFGQKLFDPEKRFRQPRSIEDNSSIMKAEFQALVLLLLKNLVYSDTTYGLQFNRDGEFSAEYRSEIKTKSVLEENYFVLTPSLPLTNQSFHDNPLETTETSDEDDEQNEFQANGLPIDHVPTIRPDEWVLSDDYFQYEELSPGDISPLYWESNDAVVDDDLRLIGLPYELTEEIKEFCEKSGLIEAFHWAAYDSDIKGGESVIANTTVEGQKWAIRRADFGEKEEDADLHWIDVIDEWTYEETLKVLQKGKFDDVLDVLAEEFDPDGYMIAGMGFMVATHSVGSRIHSDNTGGGRHFFNLVFPLILPEPHVAQLYIGDIHENEVAPLDFEYDTGVLISADTYHGTADCDYRGSGTMRVFVSIYVADLDEKNVDIIAEDGTALFPVPEQTDWLLAQQGRVWGGQYGGSLDMDRGREAFVAEDYREDCAELAAEGKCEPDGAAAYDGPDSPWQVRLDCQKSCKIFIHDDMYGKRFESIQHEFEEQEENEEAYDEIDDDGDDDHDLSSEDGKNGILSELVDH